MIGAIKRRWKSKKSKILHKGTDLSTSTDSCPTSRGFVNGCDEFEKILKPPSPRQIQIHPFLEKGEAVKQAQQQKAFRTKCSTLPPASEGSGNVIGHPFIRVNSGRIELVNKESSPLLSLSPCGVGGGGGKSPGPGGAVLNANGNMNDMMSTVEKLRRLGGRLRNDTRRSSWCGSAFRDGPKKATPTNVGGTPALLMLDEQVGRRGPVAIPVSGLDSRYPSSKLRTPVKLEAQVQIQTTNDMALTLAQTDGNKELKVYRLLEERLGVLEEMSGTLQNWQKEERSEYERCMSELAIQVSRAVALQQLMKTEVEKLQQRVFDLETHNKAMTTVIVPTLMKLHGAFGRNLNSVCANPETKKIPAVQGGTFTKSSRERENREPQQRMTQSLERKENQKRSVKSPKQRKIDCRIPRINSSRVQSQSHTNPPKQGIVITEELENKTKGFEQVESNKSSTSTFTRTATPREEAQLSSPTSSKSESSSSAAAPPKSTCRVRTTGSSSYSGIPRMSSPRPLPGKSNATNGLGSPCKSGKKSELNSNYNGNGGSSGGGGSRLPVRKNLSGGISSPLDKGNRASTERTTLSLTHLRQSPVKMPINSTNIGKSVITTATVAVVPKTGKDEGYSTMSSEALAEQENAAGKGQTSSFVMHKSNTVNTFFQSDYSYCGGSSNESGSETRSPSRRINFTSLPIGAGQKTMPAVPGPRTTVRIIRGITSYDMEMDGETTEDPSTSTILWEDSDDSDILFLPLEMSSEASSSRSTLVPSSSSFISPNGFPNPNSRNSSSAKESMYPHSLRRSRGEELVALLAAHRGRCSGAEAEQDEMDERVLIEKWMRLEDVRNQVQWDDESWDWDWDGVARTHKLSRVVLPVPEDDESEFWFSSKSPMRKNGDGENKSCSTTTTTTTTPIQIDSNTWTKSSKKKQRLVEEKLCCSDSKSNSPETLLEKVLDGGDNEVENEKGSLINGESCTEPPTPELEDVSPPVIEFTPEFYHLVNYGSNLSFSDIEHSPTTDGRKGVGVTSAKVGLRSAKWIAGKMDDKVSQTDFSNSLENLSISSELFTECRNCLELIKKLVGNGGDESSSSSSSNQGGTTLDRQRIHERDEMKMDLGSPTTWVSVPKGLPSNEVDQILEILSSSESEDVLSPAK